MFLGLFFFLQMNETNELDAIGRMCVIDFN